MVEHHFRDGRSASPCNEAILGGLALSTKQIKLGFGVTLMPFGFIHPARVAEKVATVDVLSHGRVEWGTGRSTPMEQTAFGVPTDDRSREQWREAIEIVVRMWEKRAILLGQPEPDVPRADPDAQAVPGPAPAGVAGGRQREERGQRREHGLGLLSSSLLQPVEKMAETISAYRTAAGLGPAREPADPGARTTGWASTRWSTVYDDADEAAAYGLWDSVNWWYRNLAEFTLKWELPHLSDEAKAKAFPSLQAVIDGDDPDRALPEQDMIIVGTPEECLRKILRYEAVGVDQLLCYVQFGDLPHDKVMRTLELLGNDIMPQPRRAGPPADRHRERLRRTAMIDLGLTRQGRLGLRRRLPSGTSRTRAAVLAEVGRSRRVGRLRRHRRRPGRRHRLTRSKPAGGKAFPITADMTDPAQVAAGGRRGRRGSGVDRRVRRHHRRSPLGAGREIGLDDWNWTIQNNLSQVFYLFQTVGRKMIEQGRGGAMVALASVDGINAAAMHAPYGAAKAGVISLAKTFAQELGRHGIRVNAVAPGQRRARQRGLAGGPMGRQRGEPAGSAAHP